MSKANKRGQDLTEHALSMSDDGSSVLWSKVRSWFAVEDEDGAVDTSVIDAIDAMNATGGLRWADVCSVGMACALTEINLGGADSSRAAAAWMRVVASALEKMGERRGSDIPVAVPKGVTPERVDGDGMKIAVSNGKGGLYVVGEDEGDDI